MAPSASADRQHQARAGRPPPTMVGRLVGLRQPRAFGQRQEIDDQTRRPARRDGRSTMPLAAHLDQSGDGLRRGGDQPAVVGRELDPVVGDQRRRCAGSSVEQGKRQRRLAASRRAADQHAVLADEHGAGVKVAASRHAAGRRDDEAGAEHLRRIAGRRARPGAVLGGDAAAMRLDDLPGDRQAEAGILAEGTRPRGGRCRSARRCARTGRRGCRGRRRRRSPRRVVGRRAER